MRTLILHGGLGSRLKPLADEIPKGFIPIRNISAVDRILRQVEGISSQTDIVIPTNNNLMTRYLAEHDVAVGMRLAKPSPMESVADYLEEQDEPALVWWGDTILSLVAEDMLAFHVQVQSRATIALWQTESRRELRHWGSVGLNSKGQTIAHPVPDFSSRGFIKAGAFIFEPDMSKVIRQLAQQSWDMSYIVNNLLLTKQFYGYCFEGYRINLNYGQDLLRACRMLGDHEALSSVADSSAVFGTGSVMGSNVSIGRRVRLDSNVYLEDTLILDDAIVGQGATVIGSVIGPGARIDPGSLVQGRLVTKDANQVLGQSPY